MSVDRKQARLAGELGCFVQKYVRKARAGHDPNDRGYDRKIEKAMQRLRPEDLSALLSGENESTEDEPAD